MQENLYDVLGVSSTATQEELKAAYRRLSRENHPDFISPKPGEKPDEFEARKKHFTNRQATINDAYTILSKVASRKRYDAGRGYNPSPSNPAQSEVERNESRQKITERYKKELLNQIITPKRAIEVLKLIEMDQVNSRWIIDGKTFAPRKLILLLQRAATIVFEVESGHSSLINKVLADIPTQILNVPQIEFSLKRAVSELQKLGEVPDLDLGQPEADRYLHLTLLSLQLLDDVIGPISVTHQSQPVELNFASQRQVIIQLMQTAPAQLLPRSLSALMPYKNVDLGIVHYLLRQPGCVITADDLAPLQAARYEQWLKVNSEQQKIGKAIEADTRALQAEMNLHSMIDQLDRLKRRQHVFTIHMVAPSATKSFEKKVYPGDMQGKIVLLLEQIRRGRATVNTINEVLHTPDTPVDAWEIYIPNAKRSLIKLLAAVTLPPKNYSVLSFSNLTSVLRDTVGTITMVLDDGTTQTLDANRLNSILEQILDLDRPKNTPNLQIRRMLTALIRSAPTFADIDLFLYSLVHKDYPPEPLRDVFNGTRMLSKERYVEFKRRYAES